jgi:ACR3 family arsenite efflux pump ArsB
MKNRPKTNQLLTISWIILIITLFIGIGLIFSDLADFIMKGDIESLRFALGIGIILIALFLSALAKNITNINQNIEDIRKKQNHKE